MALKRTVKTLTQWEYPGGYMKDGVYQPGVWHNPGDVEALSADDVPDLDQLIAQGTVIEVPAQPNFDPQIAQDPVQFQPAEE